MVVLLHSTDRAITNEDIDVGLRFHFKSYGFAVAATLNLYLFLFSHILNMLRVAIGLVVS